MVVILESLKSPMFHLHSNEGSSQLVFINFSDELAIRDSLRRIPTYDTVKLSIPDVYNGVATDLEKPIEEIKLDGSNLGIFEIANVPDNSGIIIISNLLEVFNHSIRSFCCTLLEIAREKELQEIRFLNGNNLKFSKILPTIKKIYEEFYQNHRQLSIFYTINNYGYQSQIAAHEGMSHFLLTISSNEMMARIENDVIEVIETSELTSFVYFVVNVIECEEDYEFSQCYKWNDDDGEPYLGLHSIRNFKRFHYYDYTQQPADWLRAMEYKEEVIAIDLSKSAIDDTSLVDILKECSRFPNLTILDISFNPFNIEMVEPLFEFLQNANKLRLLDLTNTDPMRVYPVDLDNLFTYCENNKRQDFIDKLIWYGVAKSVINGKLRDILPIEYKERCVKSHLLYSFMNDILGHIEERQDIRDDLMKFLV